MKGTSAFFIRAYFLLATVAMVISCGEKAPEDILSRAEMVQIMEELYIAEEKVNQLGVSRDSSVRVATLMGQKVFENAAVTDTVFRKSFDYYMEHPREMELIYTALVDTLQLREQRAPMERPVHQ
ncbi:MAG: DUF4296 domain-containing protein [Chryseosolibacter sp.]